MLMYKFVTFFLRHAHYQYSPGPRKNVYGDGKFEICNNLYLIVFHFSVEITPQSCLHSQYPLQFHIGY